MKPLGEVFYVKAKINNHLFAVVRITIADQEGAGDAANDPRFEFQLLLYILVTKERCTLEQLLVLTRGQLFDQVLAHKRIVYFAFLALLVKLYLNHLRPEIDLINLANDAKLIQVETDALLIGSELSLVMLADADIETA